MSLRLLPATPDKTSNTNPNSRTKAEKKAPEQALRVQRRAFAIDLAREAKNLEDAGDLRHAYHKYLKAQWWDRSSEFSGGRKRVQRTIQGKIHNLILNAQVLGSRQQWDAAISALQEAQKYDPSLLVLSYNLGITYAHENRLGEAVEELDECITALRPGKKRDEVQELRASLISDAGSTPISNTVRRQNATINLAAKGENTDFKRIEADALIGKEPCKHLQQLPLMVHVPGLTYDRGRCAELDKDLPSRAATNHRFRFKDRRWNAGLGQDDGGSQAVRSGADDKCFLP
jgi:tetratricopeptide (TPR) repeat protein